MGTHLLGAIMNVVWPIIATGLHDIKFSKTIIKKEFLSGECSGTILHICPYLNSGENQRDQIYAKFTT